MHYKQLKYNNIKGCSGGYALPELVIVSGPNGSGKSAFLEAMRLSATGRCSLGSGRQAVAKLIGSGGAASHLDCGKDSDVSSWSASVGDTVSVSWEDLGLQGGMPVTVGEWLALTEEQRLALVGGKEALEANEAEASVLREKLKQAKAAIDVPMPAAPPPYSGPPASDLEEEIIILTLRTEQHRKDKASLSARVQQASRNDALRATLSQDIAMYTESLVRLERERDEALPIFQRYNAAKKAVPPILSSYSNFGRLLSDVTDALVWLRHTTGMEIGVEIEMLRQIEVDCDVPEVRFERSDELYGITGKCPDKWIVHIEDEIRRASSAIDGLKAELGRIAPQEKAPVVNEAQYVKDVMRLDECKKLSMAAHEWGTFERRTGEWAVHRSKMIADADVMSDRLDTLRMERASIVDGLKSSIEARANDMLSRAGMTPLEIDVATTAKRASLRIYVAGVPIEALPASVFLLYGLCLLSAIHQSSNALCPLLVAECAEMDKDMFLRAVKALGTPSKGNIVLEHWLETEGSISMGEVA
jgi:hypothetical protein